MDDSEHNDINNLVQYCVCFTHQLEILEEKFPDINKDELVRCANGMVRVTKKMADIKFGGGAKVSNPISKDSVIWLLFANMLILICMTAFIVTMRESILVLESKVFPTGRMFVEEGK